MSMTTVGSLAVANLVAVLSRFAVARALSRVPLPARMWALKSRRKWLRALTRWTLLLTVLDVAILVLSFRLFMVAGSPPDMSPRAADALRVLALGTLLVTAVALERRTSS